MSGALFAFLATLLAALGARDQLLVAQISARQGSRPSLLIIAVLSSALCSAAAAWLATVFVAELPTVQARMVFAGLAMVLAGGEALLLGAKRPPEEPTHSLFAALLVLGAQQITDAARFLILALAMVTAAPLSAGMGGGAGSILALGLAWIAPEIGTRPELRKLRRLAGLFLLAAGAVLIGRGVT